MKFEFDNGSEKVNTFSAIVTALVVSVVISLSLVMFSHALLILIKVWS